jgi:predicted GH43/DUF377 family glycosyl hydrolase
MKTKVPLYKTPLAVTSSKGRIILFSKIQDANGTALVSNTSRDGTTFSTRTNSVRIFKRKTEIRPESIVSFKIYSCLAHPTASHVMTFEKIIDAGGGTETYTAFSKNLTMWHVVGSSLPVPFARQVFYIPKEKNKNKNLTRSKDSIYFSDREIWTQSKNAKKGKNGSMWQNSHIVAGPRLDSFDSQPLEAMSFIPEEAGLLVLYSSQTFSGNSVDVSIGALVCSYANPGKVLWRSEVPLWQHIFDKAEYLVPIGGEILKKNICLYWMDVRGNLISIKIPRFTSKLAELSEPIKARGPLKRSEKNPIISPRVEHNWEADGTFNPAAFIDDEGIIHLLYRAIGADGISRIGYAQSHDGLHFTKRSSVPVFQALKGFGKPNARHHNGPTHYNPQYYTSGGSWGGSEDPRTVKIGNTVYMLYVAFEGWSSVRIALTTINIHDLKNGNWKWKHPVLLSPPGQVNKNWLLFPEKIHGKFAILHSIAPKISIMYIGNPEKLKKFLESPRRDGPQPGRLDSWDNLLRGAGPPPIKTELGWLLLYHALDKRDTSKYKLGAMILDHDDPSKVLYRSNEPILSPDMAYENEGKPGVVYASGALIKNNTLFVYYGGGDRVVCVASAPIKKFLQYMKEGKKPALHFSEIAIN